MQFTIDFNGHVLDGSSLASTFMNTEHEGDQITFIDSSTGEVGGLKGMVSGKKNSFVFAGGRYSFNGLTAAEIESQWSTSLAANGWAMAEGKKFVDLEGAPDANGFMVGIGLADYDVSFRAANANTIESGKASVTIDGAAATLTEGKVTGVKMGQQVKMTAKTGYKLKKVEVKKGGAEVSITVDNVTLLVTGCTTWEQVIAKNSDKIRKSRSDDVETVDGSAFLRKGTDIVKITHTVDPNATDYNWYEM